MESIKKLTALLKVDESGEEIAEILAGILADEDKRNIFIYKLKETKNQLMTLHQEIKLTSGEEAVRNLVLMEKKPLTAQEVAEKIGDKFPSLKHRTHASTALNSLVAKGLLGKIKIGNTFYFVSPKEAVIEQLKERAESPDECSANEIARETELPLIVVLDVLKELLQ